MADQAERVILEAEDLVTPVVDKANAGLDRFEQKAESSHSKVIRIRIRRGPVSNGSLPPLKSRPKRMANPAWNG
jgi:hypothetical protein